MEETEEDGNVTKYARRSLYAQYYYMLINVPFTNIKKLSKTLTNDLIMGQHDDPRYFFVREITRLTPPRRQNNEEATAEPRFHPLSLDQLSVAIWQLYRPCWGSSSI